jgi:hypothetical protein
MQLQLKKFDLNMIPDDSNICLIGKKATGKSTCVKDLLYHKQSIPVGTVISSTESANKYFGNFVPDVFIFDKYEPYIVQNAVKRQRMIVKRMNKDVESTGQSLVDPMTFLVLDDCLYDDTWTRETAIREIFMNGRHYKFLFIVTMQYPLGIPPNLRTNIDFTFIMRENLISNRKRIWENYAGMFPTFDMFCQVLNQTSENYECMVIQNNAKSNRLEDQVFWFKAQPRGQFRMGSPEFWAMSRGRDDDDDELEFGSAINAYDPASMRGARKGPLIQVKKKI